MPASQAAGVWLGASRTRSHCSQMLWVGKIGNRLKKSDIIRRYHLKIPTKTPSRAIDQVWFIWVEISAYMFFLYLNNGFLAPIRKPFAPLVWGPSPSRQIPPKMANSFPKSMAQRIVVRRMRRQARLKALRPKIRYVCESFGVCRSSLCMCALLS